MGYTAEECEHAIATLTRDGIEEESFISEAIDHIEALRREQSNPIRVKGAKGRAARASHRNQQAATRAVAASPTRQKLPVGRMFATR